MTRSTTFVIGTLLALLPSPTTTAQPRPRPPLRPAPTAPAPTPPAPTESAVISVPVPEVDGMLRRMRVFLFVPPAGSTAFGLGAAGTGHRVWALLPSCRPSNPDDPREPCPVDRLVFEAFGGGNLSATDPQGLTPAPDARRVQSFVVGRDVQRLRIKLMGPQNRVRYEAVVEAARLEDLPAPQGEPRPDAFAFDLTLYPAR